LLSLRLPSGRIEAAAGFSRWPCALRWLRPCCCPIEKGKSLQRASAVAVAVSPMERGASTLRGRGSFCGDILFPEGVSCFRFLALSLRLPSGRIICTNPHKSYKNVLSLYKVYGYLTKIVNSAFCRLFLYILQRRKYKAVFGEIGRFNTIWYNFKIS